MYNKIAFLGGGQMTKAMVRSLLKSRMFNSSQIIISDRNENKNRYFQDKWEIATTSSNIEAVRNVDIIMLSVKPQSLRTIFNNIERVENKLILSVVAGIPLSTYQNYLPGNKYVRIMPNTPCRIQKGMSSWCTSNIDKEEEVIVKKILRSFGEEMYLENERFMDVSTALSGTGPMYTYLLVESMIDTGIQMGLSREKTKKLVYQTVLGSIEYMIKSDYHPAILRNEITSPGGTSADALYILEKKGFRTTLSDAIWAAYKKSVKLRNE